MYCDEELISTSRGIIGIMYNECNGYNECNASVPKECKVLINCLTNYFD